MIQTAFQETFGTKYPIVQAGMGPYDTTLLAAAVAKAGGLGLISTVGMGSFHIPNIGDFRYSAIFGDGSPEELLNDSVTKVLERINNAPDAKFGVNIPVSEEFTHNAARIIRGVIDRIKSDPEARKKLVAIFTSAGDPLPWAVDPLNRKLSESIAIKKELPGMIWAHVVPSVRAAKRCVKAKVDVIVASGREGGAHCSWRDTSSMVLIPEVVNSVTKPVIAAGGFADGKTLVAAFALGAIGVQMGTRLIATQESEFNEAWKDLIVSSTEEDALVARGFFGPMRFLRNRRGIDLVDATLRGAPDLYKGIPCGATQEILDLELSGLDNLNHNVDDASVLGGTVAGRVHDIPTVRELFAKIMSEAEGTLAQLRSM